ncbi:hypothetical protein, partial [Dawidia soli]
MKGHATIHCTVYKAGLRLYSIAMLAAALLAHAPATAQVRHLIQVRTFDERLKPLKNVEVSINGKSFISTGDKGEVFTELLETELPIKTLKIKNEQLEPAAWNLSKSVLEIVVRKKDYQVVHLTVRDRNTGPVASASVTFRGKKTAHYTSAPNGTLDLPIALDEKIDGPDQFSVKGYDVIGFQQTNAEATLTVELVKPVAAVEQTPAADARENSAAAANPVTGKEYFRNFDLNHLDSIQSLTVFYAIFKNVSMKNMDAATRARLDDKFKQLVTQLEDSVRRNHNVFMGRISDSSFVREDIRNLLKQAQAEGQGLQTQRTEFDEKIRIIEQKLQKGFTSLDENTRAMVSSDLLALEQLLAENESRFYKNLSDYRQIINTLKEKYFDFQQLESKLSESEAKRLQEQEAFRRQLFLIFD